EISCRLRVVHRRAFVMPAIFQDLLFKLAPQQSLAFCQPFPLVEKQSPQRQRFHIFEQMVGEQMKLDVAAQKIELPVNARQPAVEEPPVAANVCDERISVNPVHDAQRGRVSVPTVTASDARLADPTLDQRLTTPPCPFVASLGQGPRARDSVVEVVKLIIPQMAFITPV